MSITYTQDDSPAGRGSRLRILRQMAGLSTGALARQIGFSRASISYWENATGNGLTHKGAEKVIKLMTEKYHINCNVAWLLLGLGDIPKWPMQKKELGTNNLILQTNLNTAKVPTTEQIYQEIKLFTESHKNSIVHQINNNGMEPLYTHGDWVGGCWEPIDTHLLGKSCIIEIDDEREIRIIKAGNRFDQFNLCHMSYSTDTTNPFEVRDFSLKIAAPIIRVWRS
jgi:transcriptional regulator with XRE-family HTH domain